MKRLIRYLRGRRYALDLAEEMQAHIGEAEKDLVSQGLTADQARAEALRRFGNPTRLAEDCREQWSFRLLDEARQDLRFAARILLRNPLFTAAAVLSLALGIGANVVIFSAVHHVLLRPLPFPSAEELVAVWLREASDPERPSHVSPPISTTGARTPNRSSPSRRMRPGR